MPGTRGKGCKPTRPRSSNKMRRLKEEIFELEKAVDKAVAESFKGKKKNKQEI